MNVRPIVGQDIEIVRHWYETRGIDAPDIEAFPKVGYIVDGVAAGFLYQTDSSVCMLDGYITNIDSIDSVRNEAIETVTYKLISEAVKLGFNEILAFTKSTSISVRAENWHFDNLGTYTLYSRIMR